MGKSTTVYNLDAGLAMQDKKVLLEDIDSQAALTKILGLRKSNDFPYILLIGIFDTMDYRATNLAKIKVCCTCAINLIFSEVCDTIGDRKAVCAYAENDT